ncbi:hypothetical protein ACH50O_23185 (plasmid) [Methylomonas sp. 2BW1-5-20]|uniref:hypothetical protein n=1 Tax=Methylomonas sp. 2BW1-5-20 TaxID=3376686 RepID=UPI00404D39F1
MRRHNIIILAGVLLFLSSANAQNLISAPIHDCPGPACPAASTLKLGSTSLIYEPAQRLSINFSASPSAFRGFALKVGGVAFTKVAKSADGSEIIGLSYDPSVNDGMRLKVELRDHQGKINKVSAPAYDWQFVPLARYVRSGEEAAVTLFGSLADSEREEELKRTQRAMIANYHPALENTLLGLRLLQADMLVFVNEATDLFKEKGQYILGAGERKPTLDAIKINSRHFDNVQKWLDEQPEKFQSYITGDIDSDLTYAATPQAMILNGYPSWHCWKKDDMAEETALEKLAALDLPFPAYVTFALVRLQEDKEAEVEKLLRTNMQNKDPFDLLQNATVKLNRRFAKTILTKLDGTNPVPGSTENTLKNTLHTALNKNDDQTISLTVDQLENYLEKLQQEQPAEWARIEGSFKKFSQDVEEKLAAIPLVHMKSLSDALSKKVAQEGGINSYIYDTLTTSVRLAAFFRAAKAQNSQAYNTFVEQLKNVNLELVSPPGFQLITPTVFPTK